MHRDTPFYTQGKVEIRLINMNHACAMEPDVVIAELQCEISRATRKTVVLTNYDAASCYDRIIPSVAMLVSRKFGVPQTVTTMNSTTLEHAEYRIRTELGLAESGYTHTATNPIYGTGQGSANSPAIWCFLSCSLFDCYDSLANQAKYTHPTGTVNTSLGLIGFVDDCNGQANQFHSPETTSLVTDILDDARANAQHWSDILQASGGTLELSKCNCHVMKWIFSAQGAPVLEPRNATYQQIMKVEDKITNKHHSLELLSSYQAHKTLGHYKEPAGIQYEQFRKLKEKSDSITSFLWKCPLNRLEAWTY